MKDVENLSPSQSAYLLGKIRDDQQFVELPSLPEE
jgi:hypothetical protein